MARRRASADATHGYRSFRDDGKAVCDCGAEFDDDDAWRRHYMKETTAAERAILENRAETDAD